MAIRWNPSRGASLGVEWELQLIDRRTRMLRQDAREVLAELPGLSEVGEVPRLRHELMQSTIEVVTGICSTVSEAKDDLAATIAQLERITGDSRYDACLCRNASRQRLAGCKDGTHSALCRTRRAVAVACPQDSNFWCSRPCGHPRREQGDPDRQCPGCVSAAFPGADRVEPVLERARHGARIEPVCHLRRAANVRAAATAWVLG